MERSKVHEKLMDMLEFFITLCKKYNITYALCAGSLLGAVRDHKIIPWDDDIDLVVPYSDIKKLEQVSNELYINGAKYQLKVSLCGYKLYSSFFNSYPFIDIMIIDIYDDKYIYCAPCDSTFQAWYWGKITPDDAIYTDELFPLKKCKFGHLTVNIPNKSKKYLYRKYGKDCLKKTICHDHRHDTAMKFNIDLIWRHATFPLLKYHHIIEPEIEKQFLYKLTQVIWKELPFNVKYN